MSLDVLDLLTGAASAAAFVGAFCRLHQLSLRHDRLGVVAGYMLAGIVSVLIGGAAVQAAATPAGLATACAMVAWMAYTLPEWQHGVPPRARQRSHGPTSSRLQAGERG